MEQLLARWRDLQATLISQIPEILLALIVLAIALLIDERVQNAVERVVGRRDGQRELARLLGRMARIGVVIAALLIIVSIFQWYPLLASFVASLGIAGLIIAFALQDITKNFAAGVLLLLLRPFRLEDQIRVRDFEGTVTDISLRATTLRTVDGTEVLVPNADVYISPIINYTRYPRRRYHVALSLPAEVPVEVALSRLQATLAQLPAVEAQPAPEVRVTGIAGDNLTLDAAFWIRSNHPDAPGILSQATTRLHATLRDLRAQTAPSAPEEA